MYSERNKEGIEMRETRYYRNMETGEMTTNRDAAVIWHKAGAEVGIFIQWFGTWVKRGRMA
jgi:hypothetical protein